MKYTLLITGNPVDGFNFALYTDQEDAIRDGENVREADWWIASDVEVIR